MCWELCDSGPVGSGPFGANPRSADGTWAIPASPLATTTARASKDSPSSRVTRKPSGSRATLATGTGSACGASRRWNHSP